MEFDTYLGQAVTLLLRIDRARMLSSVFDLCYFIR